MAVFKEHRPGTLCCVGLASGDPDGSRDFYMNLFGWEVRQEDLGVHGVSTLFLREGDVTGALHRLTAEQEAAGTPPSWGVYLAVAEADAAAARVTELGGTVLGGPLDVAGHGRLVVAADPLGAVFCLWQARDSIGVERKNEPGAVCWTEVMTPDAAQARSFYRGLFGWAAGALDLPWDSEAVYHLLGNTPEEYCCGMMEITPDMGEVPPHWLSYFLVADIAAACLRAEELGAATVVPPTAIPDGGRFAVLRDPQGAHFGLFMGSEGAGS